jgi:hypothetical protein
MIRTSKEYKAKLAEVENLMLKGSDNITIAEEKKLKI